MFEKTDETKCSACVFSVQKGPASWRCYRNPPVPGGSGSGFPTVMPDNWCGEFLIRPKKEAVPAPEPSAEEPPVEEEA